MLLISISYAQEKENNSSIKRKIEELAKCEEFKKLEKDELIKIGPQAFPVIIELMEESQNIRLMGMLGIVLNEYKEKITENDRSKAILTVLIRLKSENAYIRLSAVSALGDIGRRENIQDVLLSYNDKDESVRVSVAEALNKLGDDKTAQEIEKILDKRNWGLKNDDIKKDYSVGSGYLAILTIKYRTIKAKIDKEQDGKIRESLIKEWLMIENKYEQILLENTSTHWLTGEFTTPSNEVAKRITARLLRKVLPDEIKLEADQKNKEIMEDMLKEAREYNDDIVSLLKETKKEQDKREHDKPKDSPDKSGKDDTDHSGDKSPGQDKPPDKK